VVLSLSNPNVSDTPPVIMIPFSIVVEALRYLEMLNIEKNKTTVFIVLAEAGLD
jgi:hypothetical protein